MNMEKSEIREMYREAKKKKEQIMILADMNQCTVQEICEVLEETGAAEHRILTMMFSKKEHTGGRKKKAEAEAEQNKKEICKDSAKKNQTITETETKEKKPERDKSWEMELQESVLRMTAGFWNTYLNEVCVPGGTTLEIDVDVVKELMELAKLAQRAYTA